MDMNEIMNQWLDKHGTVDKDEIVQKTQSNSREMNKTYLINMKPEAILDLHGLYQTEAQARLETFISDCKRRNLKKVLIIHGKGIHTAGGTDPVLGDLVHRFIEQDRRCGLSGHPGAADGGSGATWVILK